MKRLEMAARSKKKGEEGEQNRGCQRGSVGVEKKETLKGRMFELDTNFQDAAGRAIFSRFSFVSDES